LRRSNAMPLGRGYEPNSKSPQKVTGSSGGLAFPKTLVRQDVYALSNTLIANVDGWTADQPLHLIMFFAAKRTAKLLFRFLLLL
jgi:hypothetical protein